MILKTWEGIKSIRPIKSTKYGNSYCKQCKSYRAKKDCQFI